MKDKINGRTPEEIKKGLECCINWETGCIECPYNNLPHDECVVAMKSDNIAYIQQLERERDAAVKALHGVCSECIHFNSRYHPGDVMSCCKFEECVHGADDWDSEDHWQWRGVQEVER